MDLKWVVLKIRNVFFWILDTAILVNSFLFNDYVFIACTFLLLFDNVIIFQLTVSRHKDWFLLTCKIAIRKWKKN